MPEQLYQATEPATPFQRRRARQAGRIPRSAEVNAVLILAAGLAVLTALCPIIFAALSGFVREMLCLVPSNSPQDLVATDYPLGLLRRSAWQFLFIAGPACLALAVIALLSGLIQSGFYFSTGPMGIKFQRLSITDGFKRIVSVRSVLRFVLNLAKVLIVGLTAFLSIRAVLPDLVRLPALPPELLLGTIGRLVLGLGLRLILVLSLLAAIDYLLVRYLLHRDLRMSPHQLREEQREIEGSALTRRRRSSLEIPSPTRLAGAILQADLILTDSQCQPNSTRPQLALALQHHTASGMAGHRSSVRLLAKGSGAVARQIHLLASQRRMRIFNCPALARSLARAVLLNHYVPLRLYPELAQLLQQLPSPASAVSA